MDKPLTIEEYLKKTKLNCDDIYSRSEAEKIINENTIRVYRGGIKVTIDKNFTGLEIAEKLHMLHTGEI